MAVKTALESGYSLILFDFYDNQGLDEEGILSWASALAVLQSPEKEAEFAIVPHRGSREREAELLINYIWFIKERSFYEREDAIARLSSLAQKNQALKRRQDLPMTRDERPDTCPECGSDRVLPIVYGMVVPDDDYGVKYTLGGCCIEQGISPAWACSACEHRWGAFMPISAP